MNDRDDEGRAPSHDRLNRPDNDDRASRSESAGKAGNSINPITRSIGSAFPSEAVRSLGNYLACPVGSSGAEAESIVVYESDLREVLAWIERFIPRAVSGEEEVVVVDGVGELIFDGEPILDGIEIIRLNGRAFVPEAPVIVEDDPARTTTVAELLDWYRARPGISWVATIHDIERALADMPHMDRIEARRRAEDRERGPLAALRLAADTFRDYQRHHEAKPVEPATADKVRRNRELADMCERALSIMGVSEAPEIAEPTAIDHFAGPYVADGLKVERESELVAICYGSLRHRTKADAVADRIAAFLNADFRRFCERAAAEAGGSTYHGQPVEDAPRLDPERHNRDGRAG